MRISRLLSFALTLIATTLTVRAAKELPRTESGIDLAQVPKWSQADLDFFQHGSMSTEFVPERTLRAFFATYPVLFPTNDLSNFGLIPDPAFGWPVGVSRREVPHLGKLSSIGINCASCHVGEISERAGTKPVRVLGAASHFDIEQFFGTVILATFRTSDPDNMRRYLENYLGANLTNRIAEINAAVAADPVGAKGVASGALHDITPADIAETNDIKAVVRTQLRLFHNMRAALHVPDESPPASPPNGPGRNDPWRILSYTLLGVPTKPAQVKFGIVWNEDQRTWVHMDGNTRSPIIRNLAAALGLGAPLLGHTGVVDFAALERHTALSEQIRPPKYPWAIDRTAAGRGSTVYNMNCAACHDGPQTDKRLHPIGEIGTDPNRAEIFTTEIAEGFNKFFAELQIAGYTPPKEPPLRSTLKYSAPSLAGVWARAPYLHNGSVRTIGELLSRAEFRPQLSHRGSRVYDAAQMGFADEGAYILDTIKPGNSNSGHNFGTGLKENERRDLIEYLKTL